MGYFEQYPWLLIPVIVLTVEAWNALKAAVAHARTPRRENRRTGDQNDTG
ncbi:MAG: hypothetical protein JO083_05650 [Candidatus Eremiobacteraeota bacterium]|nr:hypothetical protein [Candidatus Eremiobacteraeota bacterium]